MGKNENSNWKYLLWSEAVMKQIDSAVAELLY